MTDPALFWKKYFGNDLRQMQRNETTLWGLMAPDTKPGQLFARIKPETWVPFSIERAELAEYDYARDARFSRIGPPQGGMAGALRAMAESRYRYRMPPPMPEPRAARMAAVVLEDIAGLAQPSVAVLHDRLASALIDPVPQIVEEIAFVTWLVGEYHDPASGPVLVAVMKAASRVNDETGTVLGGPVFGAVLDALFKSNPKAALPDILVAMEQLSDSERYRVRGLLVSLLSQSKELGEVVTIGLGSTRDGWSMPPDDSDPAYWRAYLEQVSDVGWEDWWHYDAYALRWEIRWSCAFHAERVPPLQVLLGDEVGTVAQMARSRLERL